MKKRDLLIILIAVLLLLTACGTQGTQAAPGTDGEEAKGYQFIFVCPIIENEYWESCIEGMRKADAELGTNTVVTGPRTADNFAVEIIDYMAQAVAAKPDGIMLYAGIEGLYPLIDQAVEAGIPVLALDSDAPSTRREAFVGTDSYNAGYKAGETLVELTGGSAKIGVMVSSMSAEKEMEVLDAFKDAISDHDIEIVDIAETDANPDVAEVKSREMLEANPEIGAFFNTAGYNVTGAARTKAALGLDELVLVGFDDVEENLAFVRQGVIDALLVQRIEQVGYQGVCLMKECVDEGFLAKSSYDTGTILVTRSNVYSYSFSAVDISGESKSVRVGYYTGDPAFQNGFSDDARKSGYAYEYYQQIAALAGWKYEYVYGSREEIVKLLTAGEVDIMAGAYMSDALKERLLYSARDMGMDGAPRYFVVNGQREDLIIELDYAMEQLYQSLPGLSASLLQKYYSQSGANQLLTDREKEWLADKGVLRIGYVRHNLPISDQLEDGTPVGAVSTLLKTLSDYLHTDIEPVCYENIYDMNDGLCAGEIDAAFPFFSDLWQTERMGFRQTDTIISDKVMIVYQGRYTDDIMDRVALSRTGIGQASYIAANYPNSEMVFYEVRAQTFEALKNGSERCMIGCSSLLQRFMAEHTEYQDLHVGYLDTSEDFGMAVNQDDSLLAGILNKAIRQMDPAAITSTMVMYSNVETEYTIKDFVQRYSVLVIAILAAFFAILLWVFIKYRRKTNRFNREQAKTQAALEVALEAANAASQAKTTFLSSMSHDIRTPMNAIVGMTAIAEKHLDDPGRVSDCLEKISLSSHHLLTLINDVLDISKIESGKLALNPIAFSLRDSVTALVNIVRPQIKAKELTFDVHIHGMEHEIVYADEVRVNQIFINILSNAVKYTPEGGKVVVDLEEQMLPDGENVRLIYSVADTGIGMSKEFMENMYDTFSRAKDGRINKIQGTGLGLSIVKQMVDLMQGTITCESEENKGTTFTITLDMPIAEKSTEKPNLPPVRVLLVDDDEIFLDSAGDTLRELGAFADTARCGAMALEMVRARHEKGEGYAVAIIDWRMPDMDGLETIKAMRAELGGDMPIILVSSYDWADVEDEAKDSGASGFISKPLFRSYIYEKIQDVLSLEDKTESFDGGFEIGLSCKHLLVAEDNDLNWEVIEELLDMYGITADHAENGQVCVDMLTAAPAGTYDLVLMDIQMPFLNGREATKLIRADARDHVRNIPIIAMTADAFAEDIAACLEVGMDGHVSKPVDMAKLFQEIKKVLEKRAQ